MKPLQWQLEEIDSGTGLLAFLKKKLGNAYSSRHLKRAIENNACTINGKVERFSSAVVGTGDLVSLSLEEGQKTSPFQLNEKTILYEDEDLLAIDKPIGYVSDGQRLLRIIHRYCPATTLLHRLDRDTSGVLCFSKNLSFHKAMISLFRQQRIRKEYFAIVDGGVKKQSGKIENHLGRLRTYQGQAIWGEVSPKEGVHAVTEWHCEIRGKNASLLRCLPKTGRTHQIRVHLSSIGHPILGDFQYGKHFHCPYPPSRILLHATSLHFAHPKSHKIIHIHAETPPEFLLEMERISE